MPSRDHFLTEKERRKRDSEEASLMLDWIRNLKREEEEDGDV